MKKIGSTIAGVVAAALLFSSLPSSGGAAEPVSVDVIIPVTGQAAFVGQVEAKAIDAAAQMVDKTGGIAGRPLQFVVHDDQSNPQTTVQFVNDAIARNEQVVLGPSLSSACGAVLPLLKDGPVAYCFSPGVHPPAGSYMFTADWSTADTIVALVRYARERGWNRVAILASTDATGQDAEHGIDAALALPENHEMTVVAREHFGISDISIAAQLARIKAANPQVLIGWASGTPFGTIVRGLTDAGLGVPLIGSNANLTYTQMHSLASFLPKDLFFAGSVTEATLPVLRRGPERNAVEDYITAVKGAGMRPEEGTLLAWDATWIVIGALRKLGPSATATQIRQYIAGLRGWVGVHGAYDFTATPQRGLDAGGVVISRWDGDKDTWIPVSRPGGSPI